MCIYKLQKLYSFKRKLLLKTFQKNLTLRPKMLLSCFKVFYSFALWSFKSYISFLETFVIFLKAGKIAFSSTFSI